METITLQAHFDGKQILLDEPIQLEPGTKLLVTVVSSSETEREQWLSYSMQLLRQTYADDEPEYSLSLIKEHNPEYGRG
ncbi:MAG: hypothetical protein IPJ07_18090 [Acidobacteria bacterium]|nr:hypothetical protein [Acidobacteriota bacterium]